MNLARNILTTFSSRIVTLLLALISSIALARILGPEDRGLFALVLLLPELVGSFGLLGFEQANAVYAGLEPEGRRALVWQSAAIASVVGGASAVVSIGFLALGAPGFHALLRGPLWLYVLPLSTIPGVLVIAYWWAILRGMNHIFLMNVIEVVGKGASLVFILTFVWWLRLGVAGAVWSDFLVNLVMVVLMVILCGRMGILGRPSFDRLLWRRTRRFALPAYCSSVLSYLNYRVDQFIIAALLPPEQLGFYIIAVSLAERLWILTGAVANALLPHLTNAHERDPELVAVIARHVTVWTGAACLLVFAGADMVVRVMYSSAFVEVVAPLRWLLPGILTAATGKVLVAEILAREKIHYTIWTAVVIAPVNIVANFVLVPHMGTSGASLASSISYSLLSLMMVWFYLRETGVPWTALVPRWSDLQAYTALWRHPTNVSADHRKVGGLKQGVEL